MYLSQLSTKMSFLTSKIFETLHFRGIIIYQLVKKTIFARIRRVASAFIFVYKNQSIHFKMSVF